MDPITTAIVAALSAGVINSLTDTTKAAVTDGYNKLDAPVQVQHIEDYQHVTQHFGN